VRQFVHIRTITEVVGAEELSAITFRTRGTFLEWFLLMPVAAVLATFVDKLLRSADYLLSRIACIA